MKFACYNLEHNISEIVDAETYEVALKEFFYSYMLKNTSVINTFVNGKLTKEIFIKQVKIEDRNITVLKDHGKIKIEANVLISILK